MGENTSYFDVDIKTSLNIFMALITELSPLYDKYIMCQTKGVIYSIRCPCKKLFAGSIIFPLHEYDTYFCKIHFLVIFLQKTQRKSKRYIIFKIEIVEVVTSPKICLVLNANGFLHSRH